MERTDPPAGGEGARRLDRGGKSQRSLQVILQNRKYFA